MSDFTIEFKEPPARASTSPNKDKGKHQQIANLLRERPGEWALVETRDTLGGASGAAWQIRHAYFKAYEPAGSFEAVARTEGERRNVYARYIGPDGDHV